MVELNLSDQIVSFISLIKENQVEVYNEVSLQLELGVYLRLCLGNRWKVQFERNISFFRFRPSNFEKREIDIVIYDSSNHTHAIELKFPRAGQHPEQMFKSCQDIKFLEQLSVAGFGTCYFLMVVEDPLFYRGNDYSGIYKYFRCNQELTGRVQKPTGLNDQEIYITGHYLLYWKPIKENFKYLLVEIKNNHQKLIS